jgi:hypothetical protein
MSEKESILKEASRAFEKQQNPWQPYRGPAGGQGWQNLITGEVRYQEDRPAPGEGVPEEYEQEGMEVPTPDEEVPETLEPEMPDPSEVFDEGDTVTWQDMDSGEEEEAEITGNVESDTGPLVETESGETFQAMWEEIEDEENYYSKEPDMGWGDGWTDAPREFTDLDTGQTVELYDSSSGEYLQGEVQMIEEDDPDFEGDYISIVTEEQGTVEIAPGLDVGEDLLVTAQEDTDHFAGKPPQYEAIDPHDLNGMGLEEGEQVAIQMDEDVEWAPDETMVGEVNESGNIELGEHDGANREINPDKAAHLLSVENAAVKPKEFAEPSELPGFEQQPEIAEGQVMQMDHPAFGEVKDEVEVTQDPQGHYWFTAEVPVGVEEGDTVEFEHPTYGNEEEGEITQIQDDSVLIDTDPDDPNVDLLSVSPDKLDDAQEVSLTSNPESPLYVGDHARGVSDPWEDTEEPGDFSGVRPGDFVQYDGEALQVTERSDDGLTLEDGTKLSIQDLNDVGAKIEQEKPEPPLGFDDWEDPPPKFNPDDTITFYDEEEGEMKEGTIQDQAQWGDGSLPVTAEGSDDEEMVDVDNVYGYADTGEPQLPEGDRLDWADPGDYVSVTFRNNSGEILQTEGYVMAFEDHSGRVRLYDPEHETIERIPDYNEAIVTGEPDPPEEYQSESDGSPDEIADDIDRTIDAAKPHLQGEVRGQLMKYHTPSAVQGVMNALVDGGGAKGHTDRPWKSDSNNSLANKWEKALSKAVGIGAPVLDGYEPSRNEIKVAETIHELSKERWDRRTPAEVYRGLGDAGAAATLSEFLADPFADEYRVPTRAVANWTEQAGTAESLGTSPLVAYQRGDEIPSDWVAAYHDDFFEGPNTSEAEISMRGDKMVVPRENIYTDRDKDMNFADPPHEWDEETARFFNRLTERYGAEMIDTYNNIEDPAMKRQQLENAVRLEQVLNENGVITDSSDFFNEVRDRLRDVHDTDPETVDYPELEGDTSGQLPENVRTVEDLHAGMEINAHWGDREHMAIVDEVRAETGEVVVEDYDTGQFRTIDATDISEVVEAEERYGVPAEADLSDWSPQDLEPLDDVKIWSAYDWFDGQVLEVEDDGTIEVSRDNGMTNYYDAQDLQSNRIVPVEAMSEDGGEPESAGSGLDPVDSIDDLDIGDEVAVEDWDGTVEVTEWYTDHEGNVSAFWVGNDENPQMDMIEPQQLEGKIPESGGSDVGGESGLTGEEVIDHLEGGPQDGVYFEIPENYDGEGIGEATAYVGGDILYETPDGQEMWISEDKVAENVVSVGEPPEGADEEPDPGPIDFDSGVEWEEVDGPLPSTEEVEEGQPVKWVSPVTGEEHGVIAEYEPNQPGGIEVIPAEGSEEEVGASGVAAVPTDEIEAFGEETDTSLDNMTEQEAESILDEIEQEVSNIEGGPDIPEWGDTDVVDGAPAWDQIEEDDYVVVDGEVYEVTDPANSATGFFTLVDDEGETTSVQEWEIDELVEPSDDDDEGETDGPVSPKELHSMNPSVLEDVTLEFPGGAEEAVVMDVPDDPQGPYEVNDNNNEDWLVWPNGEIEPI